MGWFIAAAILAVIGTLIWLVNQSEAAGTDGTAVTLPVLMVWFSWVLMAIAGVLAVIGGWQTLF